MFIHGHMPPNLIEFILVPIVKNKCANITSKDNYRPIALANIITKFIESVIISRIDQYLLCSHNQFGFLKGSSTDQCIYLLKELIAMYNNSGSTVFTCFLDASKAFDRVDHALLIAKLRARNVPLFIIRLLTYWFSTQRVKIRWDNCISDYIHVYNGVRQGGILSPMLFNVYMNDISIALNRVDTGLSFGTGFINHIMYADDLVVLSPCIEGLQDLINVCRLYGADHDILYNSKKTVSLSINKNKNIVHRPNFKLGDANIPVCEEVKYLGHIISADLSDDKDIMKHKRMLYCKSNLIMKSFSKCSDSVKCTLFQSFCSNMYCCSLWTHYSRTIFNSTRVAYNNAFRIFLRLPMRCSASTMFVTNRIPSFNENLRKSYFNLYKRLFNSTNQYLKLVFKVARLTRNTIVCHWRQHLYI